QRRDRFVEFGEQPPREHQRRFLEPPLRAIANRDLHHHHAIVTTISSPQTSAEYVLIRTLGSNTASPVAMSYSHSCHGQRRIRPSCPYRYSYTSDGNAVPTIFPRQTRAA